MFNVTREKRVHRNICQKIKRADNFDIQTAFSLRLPRLRPLLADCYATQRFFHTPDRMENIRPCFVFKKSQFQTMHLGLTFLEGGVFTDKTGLKIFISLDATIFAFMIFVKNTPLCRKNASKV